jgi:predicted RNA-binding Zn-ribbon protein involved in translation (DUF1610 family)
MASIEWRFEEKASQKLYNTTSRSGFSSKKLAKESVNSALSAFSCPSCGNKKVKGYGAIVDITKTYLYSKNEVSGFFGKSIKESLDATVYRISDPYLKKGGFLSGSGYLTRIIH